MHGLVDLREGKARDEAVERKMALAVEVEQPRHESLRVRIPLRDRAQGHALDQQVEVGSNINGLLPGDTRFDEFFAEAERLGMALFVHALHPVGAERLGATSDLVPFAAFPLDTALAAASLIRAGTLERYPRLRIGFSHGGGALVSLVPHLQRGWELSGGFGGASREPPASHARRFYYDSLVYDAAWLRHLISAFAPGQFFAGTDYPYAIEQRGLRAFLDAAAAGADEPVYAATARRFLGLDAGHT